jgi:hypothetical protein
MAFRETQDHIMYNMCAKFHQNPCIDLGGVGGTVPATLFLTFLSCSIVRVSYHIVRVSYRIVRVSYRVSGFPFSIVFCVYQVFRLSWKSFIVWLRNLSGLWIISKEKVRYSPKVLFVLSKKLFLGMFVCFKNFSLIWKRILRNENT